MLAFYDLQACKILNMISYVVKIELKFILSKSVGIFSNISFINIKHKMLHNVDVLKIPKNNKFYAF